MAAHVGLEEKVGLRVLPGAHYNSEVHCGIYSADDIPFRERLDPLSDNIRFYDQSQCVRLNIENISTLFCNTHIYMCGADRTNAAVKAAATAASLEEGNVHYEAQRVDATSDHFEAKVVNREGKIVQAKGKEPGRRARRRLQRC
ncbi:uncharacterized protein M421DRAFT_88974 [Didymella exigua CBS 183.55]|uniref:Uncharacterized protein n=1 Tax=Didymella exigua CBS 183.55 TaxID=1150837 RepID=A0A6A5RYA2_9PLEO|nr:uncharacterized protein M421DRAFT_88974 [Didymella exigua CBS 183.55]KAF1932593.1 hypothetical protein M421DRAFT_88974 [Didymella exigua CBS 183.55]